MSIFRPITLAKNVAGITLDATPKIITVIRSVAKEGSLESLLDNILPINTMTGVADMTKGWTIKSINIFLGSWKYFDKITVETISNINVIKTLISKCIPLFFPS